MTERPAFLDGDPVELRFGTSGLRGLVRDMTDLEVYINAQGFLRYLRSNESLAHDEVVLVGRDLRHTDPKSGQDSSPRIARAVIRAIEDLGHRPVDAGHVPTPALAAYASAGGPHGGPPVPALMVTGSHIPADRNGVKFYRAAGEILKSDEAKILDAVSAVRSELYAHTVGTSPFGPDGMFKVRPDERPTDDGAYRAYRARYVEPFAGSEPLAGVRVVVYEHSSVARDLLREVLVELGADVIPVGRVDHFVSIDTENVSAADEARYRSYVLRYAADALVSTDGDGDRPLLVDDRGRFHRGDELGILCAEALGATYSAVPVSATDAIELHFGNRTVVRTRIGSPYVIEALNAAIARGEDRVVGWEANGGFMTATPFALGTRGTVAPLPTRDALLPLLMVLLTSAAEKVPVSDLFRRLPQRATRAGLLDGVAPQRSRALLDQFRPADPSEVCIRFAGGKNTFEAIRSAIVEHFAPLGLGDPTEVNLVDGVRMHFDSGEIVHLRPSGQRPSVSGLRGRR